MDWGLRDFYAGSADDNARYVVVLVEGERLPLAVVRVAGENEEAFTRDLVWEPSDLLSRGPGEETWQAREAEVGYANGFMVQMVREVRAAEHTSETAEYGYFAIFNETVDVLDLDNAYLVVRSSPGTGEEAFTGNLLWERTDKLHRLRCGRDWTEEYVAISPAEAEHLKRKTTERWHAFRRYHLITADGAPLALARITRATEHAFTGGPGWMLSDLLSRAPHEPTWTVEQVDPEHVTELIAGLVRQRRNLKRHKEFPAGYAVFQRPVDVLDLDSAQRVVGEPGPDDAVALPISAPEADRLRLRISVREAKQRSEPGAARVRRGLGGGAPGDQSGRGGGAPAGVAR